MSLAGLPLFVYGTLMRGKSNHHLLANVPFLANGRVRGTLWELIPGIPILRVPEETILRTCSREFTPGEWVDLQAGAHAMVDAPQPPLVSGEIFLLPDGDIPRLLPLLDDLEDFQGPTESSTYHRVILPVYPVMEGGVPLAAWSYIDARPALGRKAWLSDGRP